jgi:hypothetical protein
MARAQRVGAVLSHTVDEWQQTPGRIVVCDGRVSGTAERAFVKDTPNRASESSPGATAPTRSARNVSMVKSSTFGRTFAFGPAGMPRPQPASIAAHVAMTASFHTPKL